jgi:hypothetical protein
MNFGPRRGHSLLRGASDHGDENEDEQIVFDEFTSTPATPSATSSTGLFNSSIMSQMNQKNSGGNGSYRIAPGIEIGTLHPLHSHRHRQLRDEEEDDIMEITL